MGVALLSCLIMMTYAVPPNEWNLGGGYDITTNYQGIDVPYGTEVTAWAATTNSSIYGVTFIWRNPIGQNVSIDTDNTPTPTLYNGTMIYIFESKFTPEYVGDGSVQAHFQGDGGKTIHEVMDVIAIRAASFNVIPEIPVIGSIGSALAMLMGLAYYRKRRTQKK